VVYSRAGSSAQLGHIHGRSSVPSQRCAATPRRDEAPRQRSRAVPRAAFDDTKQAILSQRHTEAILRLLRWFAARAWRDQPISENAARLLAPIVDVAPDLIKRCHRKARRRCKRFEELTPAERHKLRIALKKLRYTIEFLVSLLDKDKVRVFVKEVEVLTRLSRPCERRSCCLRSHEPNSRNEESQCWHDRSCWRHRARLARAGYC